MYKVTLSMPIYNVAPYVEQALLSALNQTFDSIEFLIVDDKGTDNSMEIVRKIVSEHPRGKDVRIIEHPHNIGTGAAKNTAIDNAQGKYLYFMDSDDEIRLDCVAILYRIAEEFDKPLDVVMSSCDYILLDLSEKKWKLEDLYFSSPIHIVKEIFDYNFTYIEPMWNKLFRVEFLKNNKIKCASKHLMEDQIFGFQVLLKANGIYCTSNITYKYYQRENSLMDLCNRGLMSYDKYFHFAEIQDFERVFLFDLNNSKVISVVNDFLLRRSLMYSSYILNSRVLSSLQKKELIYKLLKYDKYKFPRFRVANFKIIIMNVLPLYFRYLFWIYYRMVKNIIVCCL